MNRRRNRKHRVETVAAITKLLDTVRWLTHVATLRYIVAEDIGDLEFLAKECRLAVLAAAHELAEEVQCDDEASDDRSDE